MSCESVHDLLVEYAHGELDPPTRQRIEAHLAGCETCSAQLRAVEGSLAALRAVFPLGDGQAAAPSDAQTPAATRPVGSPTRTPHRPSRRAPMRLLRFAAALLAVAGVGYLGMSMMSSSGGAGPSGEPVATASRATEEQAQVQWRKNYNQDPYQGDFAKPEARHLEAADGAPAPEPMQRMELAKRVKARAGGRPAARPVGAIAGQQRPQGDPQHAGDQHDKPGKSEMKQVSKAPMSTFAADVDTASYANVRRHIMAGNLPPAGAVRVEEMINYFRYDYGGPQKGHPFAVDLEVAGCPWNHKHRIVRIGVQAPALDADKRPACNLVFLLDVSGSMHGADRLGLVKNGLTMLADQLTPKDKVSIVVYAGAAGVVLQPSDDKQQIKEALGRLRSGGSTAGGAGIKLAYKIAREEFVQGGVNRVILATDGDFNVGVRNTNSLVALIEEERKSGVFLSVLGVGRGNLNDKMMEKLSNAGNGNYAYLDSIAEARKVLVEQAGGTLVTVAKDVKLQVEFNAAKVASYRLIGYENRRLAARDFNDDTKDAGEIGAGHTVTALYEIVPRGDAKWEQPKQPEGADPLIYDGKEPSDDLLTLRMRYKQPDGDKSTKLQVAVKDEGKRYAQASADFKFALAVAEFGLRLRGGADAPDGSYAGIVELAQAGLAPLPNGPRRDLGYRKELISLVQRVAEMEMKKKANEK